MFVANPNKTRPIVEILVGNRDKLLKYLTDFHSDKGVLLCGSSFDLVVSGLWYMAYSDGCRHKLFIPAKAKALPREGWCPIQADTAICSHGPLLFS